jgi:hypothetical protein
MKQFLVVMVALGGVWACGAGEGGSDAAATTDTLTRRQKDSIVSNLPIPGARGIAGAMEAVDRANARVEQHDTMRQGRLRP